LKVRVAWSRLNAFKPTLVPTGELLTVSHSSIPSALDSSSPIGLPRFAPQRVPQGLVSPADTPITAADHLILAINLVGLALAGIDAYFDLGPWSAYACVLLTSGMYLAHVTWRGTSLLKTLLFFGLGGGIAELAADWWLVSVTGTLHYAEWGPFLIDSPAYMPLSWAGILLSMGYLGWVVQRSKGWLWGLAVATLVTGIYVPLYEALAHYAGWWTYSNCPMWGVVPWYIIVGEALVGLALMPLVTLVLQRTSLLRAFGLGALAGIWIGVAYYIGMTVT
jgi:hypothetical protein